MRCISPLLIRTNGRRDFVPCGKCNFCLQNKRADWSFRLLQESKKAVSSHFLTLTYDDEFVPDNHSLCKRDMQLFTKRIRKDNARYSANPLRYYSVGEYGTRTARPHYHSIMFNLERPVLERLQDIWTFGNCHVGDVSMASIHYVTKYVINKDVDSLGGREPPFSVMSKRPGIGVEYVRTHKDYHRAGMLNFTNVNGQKGRLPRYYKEKIFSAMERERLARESVALADVEYDKSIVSLDRFHSDPYYYFDERVCALHDSVKSKVNILNKF